MPCSVESYNSKSWWQIGNYNFPKVGPQTHPEINKSMHNYGLCLVINTIAQVVDDDDHFGRRYGSCWLI